MSSTSSRTRQSPCRCSPVRTWGGTRSRLVSLSLYQAGIFTECEMILSPCLYLFIFVTAIGALHIERLVVPGAAKQGDDLQLSCYYHLEDGENLYALRWYKDEKEFFRYMPKETPAQRVFNASGVRINMGLSTSNTVMLIRVDKNASGLYKCEISLEAPSFETDTKEAHFVVVEPPVGNPFITLAKGTLGPAMNESIMANCSGPAGRPVPQLSWTLASHAIPSESKHLRQWLHHEDVDEDSHSKDRMTSMLHLPPDWIKKFMGLVQASRAQNLPLGVTTQGPFVILPLRCTSHIHGLFELTDTVDIRIRVRVDDTQAATLGPAVGSRSASTFSNTRPGAFTNAAAASSFNFSGTSWMTLLLGSSVALWTITPARFCSCSL